MTTTNNASIWTSQLYASRGSRTIVGNLTIEGDSRDDVLATLVKMAALSPARPGSAAHTHAARALAPGAKHTIRKYGFGDGYAAKDGTWRNGDGRAHGTWS